MPPTAPSRPRSPPICGPPGIEGFTDLAQANKCLNSQRIYIRKSWEIIDNSFGIQRRTQIIAKPIEIKSDAMSLLLLVAAVTTLVLGTTAVSPVSEQGIVDSTCRKLAHLMPEAVYVPSSTNYSSLANENWSVKYLLPHFLVEC